MADKFKIGMVVLTTGIFNRKEIDSDFAKFVDESLERFKKGDWGTVCKETARLNKEAIKSGDLDIRGIYTFGTGERIWIVAEPSVGYTTILFPHEH